MGYSDNYLKTSKSLLQYCGDKSALGNNGNIANFSDKKTNNSFELKEK